jgi:hypothetical protein
MAAQVYQQYTSGGEYAGVTTRADIRAAVDSQLSFEVKSLRALEAASKKQASR